VSLCGDGRPARPSGAKLRRLCPTTNLAKFLHLQVLMWPDLLKNYTTFGAAPKQATVGLSGSAQGLLSGGVEGLLLGGAAVYLFCSRRPILTA
jgi:hypothetical protein